MLARGVGNERASSSCGAAFYFLVRSFRCKGVLIRWQLHRTESNNQRFRESKLFKHMPTPTNTKRHIGVILASVLAASMPQTVFGGPRSMQMPSEKQSLESFMVEPAGLAMSIGSSCSLVCDVLGSGTAHSSKSGSLVRNLSSHVSLLGAQEFASVCDPWGSAASQSWTMGGRPLDPRESEKDIPQWPNVLWQGAGPL